MNDKSLKPDELSTSLSMLGKGYAYWGEALLSCLPDEFLEDCFLHHGATTLALRLTVSWSQATSESISSMSTTLHANIYVFSHRQAMR